MINKEELEFFNQVKDNCNVIFDVGTRNDITYLENSSNKEFHLFEPNTIFFGELKNNIKQKDHLIFLNNFGLSNKTGMLEYYEDSQSFLKRFIHFKSYSKPIFLPVVRFSTYVLEKGINKIDFMKLDVEGCEPDILLDNIDYVKNNISIIQFEYASTWLDRDDKIDLTDIYNIYNEKFVFCFLYSNSNPLHELNPNLLTEINKNHIAYIERVMRVQYGFEIIMIRK